MDYSATFQPTYPHVFAESMVLSGSPQENLNQTNFSNGLQESSVIISRNIENYELSGEKNKYHNEAHQEKYPKISWVKSALAVTMDKLTLADIFMNPNNKEKFLPNIAELKSEVKLAFEENHQKLISSQTGPKTIFHGKSCPPVLPEDTEFPERPFYPLLQNLLKCVSLTFPWLIVRVFETNLVNSKGIYAVWLNMNGIWKLVVTKFEELNSNQFESGVLWYSIMMASFEKFIHEEKFEARKNLSPREILKLLTGGAVYSFRLNISNDEEIRRSLELVVEEKKRTGNFNFYGSEKIKNKEYFGGGQRFSDFQYESYEYSDYEYGGNQVDFYSVFQEEMKQEILNALKNKWLVFCIQFHSQKLNGNQVIYPILDFDEKTNVIDIGNPLSSEVNYEEKKLILKFSDFFSNFDELLICRIQKDFNFTTSKVKFNASNPLVRLLNRQNKEKIFFPHSETKSLQSLYILQIWEEGEYIIEFCKKKDPFKFWKNSSDFKSVDQLRFNSSITLGYMDGDKGMKFVDSKFDSEKSSYLHAKFKKGEYILLLDLRYIQEDWTRIMKFGFNTKKCWNRVELASLNAIGPASCSLIELEQDLEGFEDLKFYFGFFQQKIWRNFSKHKTEILEFPIKISGSLLSPLNSPSKIHMKHFITSNEYDEVPTVIPRLQNLVVKIETFYINHLLIMMMQNTNDLGVTFEVEVMEHWGYETVIPTGEILNRRVFRVNLDPGDSDVVILRFLEGKEGFEIGYDQGYELSRSSQSSDGKNFITQLR